jgi:hypothetical protein
MTKPTKTSQTQTEKRGYYLTEDAHRALVAGGTDTPRYVEIEVSVPREWIVKYPMTISLRMDGSWGIDIGAYGSSHSYYAPGLGYSTDRRISKTYYHLPDQDHLLTPAEYLSMLESEIIRVTAEAEMELSRRLEQDRIDAAAAAELAAQEREEKIRVLLQLQAEGKLYQSISGTWTRV